MKTKILILAGIAALTSACAANTPPKKPGVQTVYAHIVENKVPGTVSQPWVEQMHDQIEVPGSIDPTNTYYRPPHKTVVEIRPGRFQKVQFPDEYGYPGR